LDILMENRTTIVIAHRLSTIKKAGQIIFLDHGEVTGRGRHEELMQTHAMYQQFVETQNLTQHRAVTEQTETE
ncbi:ABC transporter ATP-binding protein, partial [Staphylococcus pseudintermedius]|nr:ABC transporter ATP-binding protein [Staphylococcus pseudintermedius]